MRVRYKTSEGGKTEKTAEVYTRKEHGIPRSSVDPDAVKVIRRLERFGHEAYVVGGAVRDLLLGKQPKDFDIATNATPNQIRKLFRNSRVIGRRFRLVHILFRDKIIEVSTFRGREASGFNNVYGEIEEDVIRRDFSANALYYSPTDETVVDFVGGVRDLRKKRLVPVIPLDRLFTEDPVRMIRAIKYSTTGGLRLSFWLRRRIVRDRALLADVPASRLTEEAFKILNSGWAASMFRDMRRYGLLKYLLPGVDQLCSSNGFERRLMARLSELDALRHETGAVERGDALAALCGDYLLNYSELSEQKRIPFREAYFDIKMWIQPVTPANKEVEWAINRIFRAKKHLARGRSMFETKNGHPVAG